MYYFKNTDSVTVGILGLGYIGTNILNYLNKEYPNINIISINRDNITTIEEKEFDYFINCAGNSGDFRLDVKGTILSNINLNLYLTEKLSVRKKYIYLSSTRIYGFSENKNTNFTEDYITNSDHLNLDYIYNGSKKLCESIIINSKLSSKSNIIRLSNVYGNFIKLDDSTLIKKLNRYKDKKVSINVDQNIKSRKDYVHIEDAINGILKVLVYKGDKKIFNIASGVSYSLEEIVEGTYIDLNTDSSKPKLYSNISIERAKKELKYTPAMVKKNNIISRGE